MSAQDQPVFTRGREPFDNFIEGLGNIDPYVFLLFAFVVSVAVGMVASQAHRTFKFGKTNEIVGFTFSVIGVIFGIVIGLKLLDSWQRWGTASNRADSEVSALAEAAREVRASFPASAPAFDGAIQAYTLSVVQREWPYALRYAAEEPQTAALFKAVYDQARAILAAAATDADRFSAQEIIKRMDKAAVARSGRYLESRATTPAPFWLVIVLFGALLVVYPTFFFEVTPGPYGNFAIGVSTAGMLFTVLMVVALIAHLQHPFTGAVHLPPTVFVPLALAGAP